MIIFDWFIDFKFWELFCLGDWGNLGVIWECVFGRVCGF